MHIGNLVAHTVLGEGALFRERQMAGEGRRIDRLGRQPNGDRRPAEVIGGVCDIPGLAVAAAQWRVRDLTSNPNGEVGGVLEVRGRKSPDHGK